MVPLLRTRGPRMSDVEPPTTDEVIVVINGFGCDARENRVDLCQWADPRHSKERGRDRHARAQVHDAEGTAASGQGSQRHRLTQKASTIGVVEALETETAY
jgi:hypothetical protein